MPIVVSANLPTSTCGKLKRRKADALPSEPSRSTLWRRADSKPSQLDKAAKQQYLTPTKENALLGYVLQSSERGYPLAVRFLRSLALVIAHQRPSQCHKAQINGRTR